MFDEDGNFVANGTIEHSSLNAVHGLAFSRTGELFAGGCCPGGAIARFRFSPTGAAVPNGTIATGMFNIGLAFSPHNELFVTAGGSSDVFRYAFGQNGTATPNGSFTVPGSAIPTGWPWTFKASSS